MTKFKRFIEDSKKIIENIRWARIYYCFKCWNEMHLSKSYFTGKRLKESVKRGCPCGGKWRKIPGWWALRVIYSSIKLTFFTSTKNT